MFHINSQPLEQSVFTQIYLPIALGIIMLGLGLSLTIDDFRRVLKYPRAITVALLCQMILLPMICFIIVKFSNLTPALAVGMMLLAASPGGATSNLYSHLAKGDVALNISLTAINSVLSLFILPLIVNLSLTHFMDSGQYIPMQFKKVAEVFTIVLLPVAIGMLFKKLWPSFADLVFKPVKIISALLLLLIIIALVIKEKQVLADNFRELGLPILLFNVTSITIGYFVPRLLKIERRQSITISMEIGIHNGTIAIYIALSVLQSATMSVPAAIYSILMFISAAIFGYWVNKRKD
jgi:bile acid:Na+ symporter, BASS family